MNAEAAALAHVGQIIASKYRLVSLLGAGGMGAVYEAEHVFTKRRVALKRMHQSIAKSKLAAERFVRESQAPSSIGHPGIVQVLDGGCDDDGSLYLVLELLDGVSMREALDEDALRPHEVVQIGSELLEALASAHDKGFVHRDIKPDNVFLAHDGRGGVTVKLLDFGIASVHESEADAKLTHTGAVLGTPLYMSPEQAEGQRVDARSDLWSVGALLYRALSGASPFHGESYNALIVSIVTRAHVPLSEQRRDLPVALYEVVEGALQKDVGRRFQSARAMLDALRGVSFVEPVRRADERCEPARALEAQPAARPSRATPAFAAPLQTRPSTSSTGPNWTLWLLTGGAIALALVAVPRLMGPRLQASLADASGAAVSRSPAPPPSAARSDTPPATAAPELGTQIVALAPGLPLTAADAGTLHSAEERSPAQLTAAEGLATAQITRVLAAQQPRMQDCLANVVFSQAEAATRQLRLFVELRIAPSGRLESVRTEGAVPVELERCVRLRLQEAVFPSAARATEFRYPMLFESTVIGN